MLRLFGSAYELQQMCRMLFERNLDPKLFGDNHLIVGEAAELEPDLILAKCTTLPEILPNINNLSMQIRTDYEQAAPEMLDRWKSGLKELSLSGMPKSPELTGKIWAILSEAKSLKKLFLVQQFRNAIPVHLPIFPQLTDFGIIHYLPELLPVLSRLTSVKAIVLSWVYLSVGELEQILKLNPNLRNNLTRLSLGFISSHKGNREKNFLKVFAYICHNFQQLEYLDIAMADHVSLVLLPPYNFNPNRILSQQPPLSDLIPNIAHLSKLTTLWLYISSNEINTTITHFSVYKLPRLTSITNVNLEVADLTLDQFYQHITWLFPNLEILSLRCPDFDAALDGEIRAKLAQEFKSLKLNKCKFRFV